MLSASRLGEYLILAHVNQTTSRDFGQRVDDWRDYQHDILPSKMGKSPVQTQGTLQSSTPAPSSEDHASSHTNIDADIDKFATLFSPATPRASPTLQPIAIPAGGIFPVASSSHIQKHPVTPGSSDSSDFGSFVSVPASQDPLSLLSSPPSSDSFVFPAPTLQTSQAQPTAPGHARNSSFSFFDKFAQEAKVASERKKHHLLDELLLHESDPMYWLKEQTAAAEASDEPSTTLVDANDDPEQDILSASLADLDVDYFTAKPPSPKLSSPPASSRHTTRSSSSSHSPTRSPTLPLPPTLAPPLASTPDISSSPMSDPLTDPSPARPSVSQRPASYQTLTNLSSRWMSSFLNTARTAPIHQATASLESLFSGPYATDTVATSRSSSRNRSSLSSGRRTPTPSHPQHASTLPSTSPAPVHIFHGTPFGPSSHISPFAAHVYIPPSGAPGFKGEGYDWDKGYSSELERELALGEGDERELVGIRQGRKGKGKGKGSATVLGVGDLMEKKSGSVELRGRQGGTTPVLSVELADLIRPHLPALSRLPRKWTLLYSLDQDGISLKTLYSQCEAQTQAKADVRSSGALVVVKDAGDAIFGAWVGEGVRLSRGKGYYGSGESFLWRYVAGIPEVYKWTGKNDYVALCEPDFISFGGGDGHYGLYLDDSLFDGSTARCPTFENDPLCSPGPKKGEGISFECVGLEVWGVGP